MTYDPKARPGLSRYLPINYEPGIPGLDVEEASTPLAINLAWHAWDWAVAAMDDCGQYATKHLDELKGAV